MKQANPHNSVLSNTNTSQQEQTAAVDYFILRLSELEYRVRQTETYIKYADELKDLRGGANKEKKLRTKDVTALNEKIGTLDRRSNEFSERMLTLESKFTALDKDLRQQFTDFEAKYVTQQLDLTQSLQKVYTFADGLKEEIEESVAKRFGRIGEFRGQVEGQLATFSKEMHMRFAENKTNSDKQMQEVCMMIEELAKVVKKFEGQLGTIKIQTDLMQISKIDSIKLTDLEKVFGAQIEGINKRNEEW